jgi:glycosyltransferase involved in cell wall biosynthesis
MSASVCFVTHELQGIPRSGGIGTAFSGLAEALAAAGHPVCVLITGFLPLSDAEAARLVQRWHSRGVTVEFLPPPEPALEAGPFSALSWRVQRWLRGRRFEIVHFADWTGLGFWATAAKRQGLAFANTCLVVGLHGPTRWTRDLNRQSLDGPDDLEIDFLERRAAEQADLVISPSAYLLDWIQTAGWRPAAAEVRQNRLPGLPAAPPAAEHRAVRELVFFGRLEERKGVALFCDALDRLNGHAPAGTRVTFLGPPATVAGEDGATYVRRRAAGWGFPLTLIHDYDAAAALDYLRGPERLAVVPSLGENSPCTVAECAALGIPLLASRVGGTAELLVEEDGAALLFPPEPEALAVCLGRALTSGVRPARPRRAAPEITADWLAWHAARTGSAAVPDPEPAAPAAGYRLLPGAGGLEPDETGRRLLAAAAARTGAAILTGLVMRTDGAAGRLPLGGPAALAAWRNPAGDGPLLVRADLPAELSRLLAAGASVEVLPDPIAEAETLPPSRPWPNSERRAALSALAPAALRDLAEAALGLAERSALQAAAAAAGRQTALAERNGLFAELEAEALAAETGRQDWRMRLAGLLAARSWTVSAGLRRRWRPGIETRLAGLPPEAAVDALQGSLWWELTAPLRLLRRRKRR